MVATARKRSQSQVHPVQRPGSLGDTPDADGNLTDSGTPDSTPWTDTQDGPNQDGGTAARNQQLAHWNDFIQAKEVSDAQPRTLPPTVTSTGSVSPLDTIGQWIRDNQTVLIYIAAGLVILALAKGLIRPGSAPTRPRRRRAK